MSARDGDVRAATYLAQLEQAQREMLRAGLTDRSGRAPRVGGLRRLLRLPPAALAPFAVNAVVMGAEFGVAWGLMMWLSLWAWQGAPAIAVLAGGAVAGVAFGIGMAAS